MFEPLFSKEAEPPPPKGVSLKEWDRHLEKGPSPHSCGAPIKEIRKAAAALSFEQLTAPLELSSIEGLAQVKAASVEDPDLFKVAAGLSEGLESALEVYEQMGGTYKQAFGVPMFNMNQQLAGSPSVSGGMSRRNASTPSAPSAPAGSPQAPKASTSASGGTSTPSVTSATPAAAATPAPSMVG